MTQPLPRRRFIKGLVLGTITSTFLNKPWSAAYAAEQATSPAGIVKLSIQDYPPLQEAFGSVRIGVNPIEFGEGAPLGYFYPIIINRGQDDDFYVLNGKCKHAACVVRAYETFESGMRCICHGSLYSLHGNVIEGPAESPLDTYEFTRDGDLLTIQVPDLAYAISLSRVQSPSARLRVTFTSYPFVEYELHFREKATDPWTIVPFSLTPEGPITEEVFVHQDNITATSFYVERSAPTGFYSVGMRLKDVTPVP